MSQAASGALNGVSSTARRKHPRGLWVLFIVEMWERYAFYTMQALLVLFLIEKVAAETPPGPGFGWGEKPAQWICGLFMGLTYLTPIVGGWLADRWLGTHRSMVIGGIIIALGQFCLAATELLDFQNAAHVTIGSAPGPFFMFFGGISLIIIGCGFFKPCAAVMVGQLYKQDDARRDAGYTIFYMGINVGAAMAGIMSGWFAFGYGWQWGFASGGVGMLLGLAVYRILRPTHLKGIGLSPQQLAKQKEQAAQTGEKSDALEMPEQGESDEKSKLEPYRSPEPVEDLESKREQAEQAEREEYERTRPLTRIDWDRIIVIVVLTMFAGVYWVAMKQQATSLTVFAEKQTDRTIPMLKPVLPESWYESINPFPAPWYQSVNPVAIILFAPVFAWLWGWLDRRGWQPSTPVKFGIGLLMVGIAYFAMIIGSLEAAKDGLAGPEWLVIMYTIGTFGELCVSPVGLSMVTKLSPVRSQSMMMGLYFGILFVANFGAGPVGALGSQIGQWGAEGKTFFPGQTDFFVLLAVVPIVVGLIVLVLSPKIKRMMHGIH